MEASKGIKEKRKGSGRGKEKKGSKRAGKFAGCDAIERNGGQKWVTDWPNRKLGNFVELEIAPGTKLAFAFYGGG